MLAVRDSRREVVLVAFPEERCLATPLMKDIDIARATQ